MGDVYDGIWWASSCPLLAVASTSSRGGHVHFLQQSGSRGDTKGANRPANVITLAWNPFEDYLVAAWSDGALTVVTPHGETVEVDSFGAVDRVMWSTSGHTLLATNTEGEIRLYSFENQQNKKRATARADGAIVCQTTQMDDDDFVLGTTAGAVLSLDTSASLRRIFDVDAPIETLFRHKEREALIVFAADLSLRILTLTSASSATETKKVKLTGRVENIRLSFTDGMLLVCNREKEIRLWDMLTDTNISLPMNKFSPGDVPCCANGRRGIICAGTTEGKVATWRKKRIGESNEYAWTLQTVDKIGSKIVNLEWSPVISVLAVNTGDEVILLHEEVIVHHLRGKIAAIQTASSSFVLLNSSTGVTQELRLPFQAKGIFLAEKQLLTWSSDTIAVFDVQSSLASFPSTSFACACMDAALYQQTVVTLEPSRVNLRTIQGTVKQQITVPEMEGDPCHMHVNRSWLCITTTNYFIRVYDLTKREARQHYLAKHIDGIALSEVKINVNGTRVALTTGEPGKKPDGLVVWDAEADILSSFSLRTGLTDEQELEEEAERANTTKGRPTTAAARRLEREKSRFCLPFHTTASIYWDENDARFLVCEALPEAKDGGEALVLTALATTEFGLLPHALQPLPQSSKLIGIAVPNMFFLKNRDAEDDNRDEYRGDKMIGKMFSIRSLQEFTGVDGEEETSRAAMIDFCLFLTLGRIDDAFKAIKYIKSDRVWEQMAAMSVKAHRVDVAMVCLGHMKQARSAAALRRASDLSPALKCALLAVELGMLALKVASDFDRIHVKRVHFEMARYYEEGGDVDRAITHYESACTANQDVPRMLCDKPKALEAYVRKKREPELQKWWGRYLESMKEFDGALNFYAVADDVPSMVRIKHEQGHIDEAIALAQQNGNPSACLRMGRICESLDRVEDAVQLYTKANALASAIRLAMEHDMSDRLANLCLMAGPAEMALAAQYYEEQPGHAQTAVMLYHKAGMVAHALDLAFRTEQYSALDLVTKELSPQSDPNTLQRASEFFLMNHNYEKAVELLGMAQKLNEAIEICEERNVRMTNHVATLLTPTKEQFPDASTRRQLLIRVGELCLAQGAFQSAAKKFAQAGDMLNAMRALVRSGDTQRVVHFATTARNREVYVLAANYLQSTKWRGDVETIRYIEMFYTKANAYEHLARFYMACAYMELEDYADIEKGLNALEEASKCAKQEGTNQEVARTINKFIQESNKLLKIRRTFDTDPNDAIRMMKNEDKGEMLDHLKVITLMAKTLAVDKKYKEAYMCIDELQKKLGPGTKPSRFVPPDTLDEICDGANQTRITEEDDRGADSDGADEVDFSFQMQRRNAT